MSREQVSAGDLLALSSGSGNLYATGHDRSVNIIAPKNWKIMGAWQGALKYEVGHVMQSRCAPSRPFFLFFLFFCLAG